MIDRVSAQGDVRLNEWLKSRVCLNEWEWLTTWVA